MTARVLRFPIERTIAPTSAIKVTSVDYSVAEKLLSRGELSPCITPCTDCCFPRLFREFGTGACHDCARRRDFDDD